MDKESRRRRRKDLARMKRRARKIYKYEGAEKLANHIKNCSCLGCCNLRKTEGPTRQERKADDLDDGNSGLCRPGA